MEGIRAGQIIEKELNLLKSVLRQELSSKNPFISELDNYILDWRGKFLRPALAILSARTLENGNRLGANGNKTLIDLAAAIEIIHTATLVHDDVVDCAKVRRHKPSVNMKFGTDVSILAGDRLYSKAFKIISSLKLNKLTSILAGVFIKICEAELEQVYLRANPKDIDEDKYLSITRKKTAELMSFACLAGASLVSGFGRDTQRLAGYGLDFGMAFQIIDDCNDLMGDEAHLGKTLGTDIRQGKLTLPIIYLLGTKRAKDFRFDNIDEEEFLRIREAIHDTGSLEKAKSKAKMFLDKAREDLGSINDSVFKRGLLDLVESYC